MKLLVYFFSAFQLTIGAQTLTDNGGLSFLTEAYGSAGLNAAAKAEVDSGFYALSAFNYYAVEGSIIEEIKDTFNYNAYGDMTDVARLFWKNGSWETYALLEYEYNEKRQLLLYSYQYNYGQDLGKTEYTYDDMDSLIQELEYIGAASEFDTKIDLTRDGDGFVTEEKHSKWSSSAWVNSMVKEYSYNSAGKITSCLRSIWKSGAWVKKEKTAYKYNSQNNVSEITQQRYDDAGQTTSEYKEIFLYNADNKIKAYAKNKLVSAVWENVERIEYEYNAEGILITETMYSWISGAWENANRRSWEIDANGYTVSVIVEGGVSSGGWSNAFRTNYQYDEHGNMIYAECKSWDGTKWMDENGTFFEEPILCVGLYGNGKYVFIKDPSIGNEEDHFFPAEFSLSQNYPNPFNPETKISFSLPQSGKVTLKVYDMLGREVMELANGEMEKGPHTVNFSGRNLSSGVYIYRLQSGSFTESKKMVLLK